MDTGSNPVIRLLFKKLKAIKALNGYLNIKIFNERLLTKYYNE